MVIGLWMVATLLLVSSCTTRKKMVKPEEHAGFQWMTAKVNGTLLLNPSSSVFNFTGTVRMRCDSAIWVSASAMLGIENIRALITNDSIVMINRMDQTYLAEPLAVVAEKFHLPSSFQELQTLLLGGGATDPVELHLGPNQVNIKYSDVRWDEPTTFPIKINKNYERMKL